MKETTVQRVNCNNFIADRRRNGYDLVESPALMSNETFGPTLYFTLRSGEHYVEYGVKPNGDVFTVR